MDIDEFIIFEKTEKNANTEEIITHLKISITEKLNQSTKLLQDEINDHSLTKKELAEAKHAIKVQEKSLANQEKLLANQEEKTQHQQLEIDAQAEQMKYLVDKIHQLEDQNRLNEKKRLIVQMIIIATTILGLVKIIKK